jgi:predicted nuclease with TOPRIM domain
MPAKRIVCFFIVLLLLSTLTCSARALPDTTVTVHGAGVTIGLTFPEEAHPDDNIWHNATLTANSELTLYNLTLIVKAPVNSNWQEATSWSLSNRVLQKNESLMEEMYFQLPSNANGTLQCFIYINTNQSADYLSTTFYTTRVSELTFSEMQSLYYDMLENYTTLQDEYKALNESFTTLFANYTALLSEHNQLQAQYDSQNATYQSLLAQYNTLSDDYDTLNANYKSKINQLSTSQSDYDKLNSTRYSLQTSYSTLQAVYDGLNQTYTELQNEFASLQERINVSQNALNSDRIVMFIFIVAVATLIAFIVYIKRKKQEPYVVIRKETVSMKQDEES